MFLSNPFPNAFGLCLDDLSATLVQLAYHGPLIRPANYSVTAIRTVALPPGSIVNGEIEQPEIVRKKILHLLGYDKTYKLITSPWVVANLPEPKTFIKLLDIPVATKDLSPEDIDYHATKHLPFDAAETYLDWQITKSGEHATQLLLAGVAKKTADAYTYLLEACGLNPLALEVEAAALARTLITNSKDYTGEARALLNLGETRSSLVIYDKNSLQFTTTITFSETILTTALSQGLKLSYEDATKILFEKGCTHDSKVPNYTSIIDKELSALVDQVRRALQFYRDHFQTTDPITHITMCGALATLPNLDLILSQKLKISAHPGNIWKNLALKKKSDSTKTSDLSLTTALGLALRAATNPLADIVE